MLSPESRFRRFARAVTTEVGALDGSFLGLGRPLGSARVLNAVGQGRSDVAALRTYLRLDSGLLSRLLRGLEEDGLIVVRPDEADRRRRLASLTAAGRRAFEAYETLSDERARSVLTRHSRSSALLDAFDMVASALMHDQLTIARADPCGEEAAYCLGRYYEELGRTFENGFEVGKSRDPKAIRMMAPRGAFLIGVQDGMPVGCVGLSGDGGQIAEVKRLWVAPCARGLGFGRRLMQAVEDEALALAITTLRLDTNRALPEARELYLRTGWTEIERFNDDPYADFFFEKRLMRDARCAEKPPT